jgi:hypothetical protein
MAAAKPSANRLGHPLRRKQQQPEGNQAESQDFG